MKPKITPSASAYKIIDSRGKTIYTFNDLSWLVHSEIFNYQERQLLREGKPLESGLRMIEVLEVQ